MPKGLLDKLTSEEILDLIAYDRRRAAIPSTRCSRVLTITSIDEGSQPLDFPALAVGAADELVRLRCRW